MLSTCLDFARSELKRQLAQKLSKQPLKLLKPLQASLRRLNKRLRKTKRTVCLGPARSRTLQTSSVATISLVCPRVQHLDVDLKFAGIADYARPNKPAAPAKAAASPKPASPAKLVENKVPH